MIYHIDNTSNTIKYCDTLNTIKYKTFIFIRSLKPFKGIFPLQNSLQGILKCYVYDKKKCIFECVLTFV